MKATFLLVAMLGYPALVSAAVITEDTTETSGTLTEFFGESFTTPSGGPWNDVTFNFFSDIPAATPSAGGTAFLFSQPYTGTPAGLSSSAPGFIAASTGISGGAYDFAPGVQLAANTVYYLFENGSITTTGGNAISGASSYFSTGSSVNFMGAIGPAQTSNFEVTGTLATSTPAATPEAPTIALFLVAMMSALAFTGCRQRVGL